MYDKSGWKLRVRGWEAAVYNPGEGQGAQTHARSLS